MTMTFRPSAGHALVRRDPADDKTKGGLVLPDIAKRPVRAGTVLAVGPGRTLKSGATVEPQVAVGDRVLFGAYAGDPIAPESIGYPAGELRNGAELLVVDEADVQAKVTE